MGRRWLAMLFAVGCYHPTLQLDVPCTSEGECPSGQMCVSDRCVANGTRPDSTTGDAPIETNHLDAAFADAPTDGGAAAIVFRSEKDIEIPAAAPVTSIAIGTPNGCPTGALMIAALAMGVSGQSANPVITAPNNWTLVRRLDHPFDLALAIYIHVAGNSEPGQHTWTTSNINEGVAWIACYSNVDPMNPIDDENGIVSTSNGPAYPAPSVSPDVPNTMLVGFIAGHGGTMVSWTPPAGTTERLDVQNGTTRSGSMEEHFDTATGPTAMLNVTASSTLDFAAIEVLALRPKN